MNRGGVGTRALQLPNEREWVKIGKSQRRIGRERRKKQGQEARGAGTKLRFVPYFISTHRSYSEHKRGLEAGCCEWLRSKKHYTDHYLLLSHLSLLLVRATPTLFRAIFWSFLPSTLEFKQRQETPIHSFTFIWNRLSLASTVIGIVGNCMREQ